MERKENGRSYRKQAARIDAIRCRPNTIVIVGSANLAKASTETNDDNMLAIRSDGRVTGV